MVGVLVNVAAILIGGIAGLFIKKGLPEKFTDAIMKGVAVCVTCIGILGIFNEKAGNYKILIMIISIVIGVAVGELIDIDRRLRSFAESVERKFAKKENKKSNFAEGFVSATLLFCVGAMAVVGSIEAGTTGSYETLYAKSVLDGISSLIYASILGIGVACSGISVLIFQGAIALLANYVQPYLSDIVVANMSVVGSALILALSFNMLGITKLKIANFLPAVFIPIGLVPLINVIV